LILGKKAHDESEDRGERLNPSSRLEFADGTLFLFGLFGPKAPTIVDGGTRPRNPAPKTLFALQGQARARHLRPLCCGLHNIGLPLTGRGGSLYGYQ
jgi:hypothetical protein